jgi:ferric-dicitrate binding protein FerR (iron transport regulator)
MIGSLVRYAAVFAATVALTLPAPAATPDIGTTLLVVRTVTGELATQVRRLVINDGVQQNELIATAPDSASQLEFIDGTKLTLGPRARVTLDRFVFDPKPTKGAFFLSVGEGVFRFVTGAMAHENYAIHTPNGTAGVRGTAFNMLVLSDRTICQVINGEVVGEASDHTPKQFHGGDYFTMGRFTRPSSLDDQSIIDAQVALMDSFLRSTRFAGLNFDTHPLLGNIVQKQKPVSPIFP